MLVSKEEREAAASFKAAVIGGNVEAFCDELQDVERHWAWEQALRAISQIPAPLPIRVSFLEACAFCGDTLRSQVNNDQLLIRAFRSLLPQYDVP